MHKAASTRLHFILCALLALPTFGCDDGSSDDDGTGGTPSMMPTGGTGGGGASGTGDVIANCETESTTPGVYDGYFKDEGRGWEIAWFTYTDNAEATMKGSALGMITPPEGDPFVCVTDADATRSHVFNAKGGPFSVWGAGMGFNMKIAPEGTPPGVVDLSAYKGIRFYAKVNNATTGTVRVKMVDAQTTPPDGGGTCMAAAGACHNNFGFVLTTISQEWQQFTVDFAQMTQETWSSQKFTAAQSSQVIGFQFQVGKTSFDYSVDDFELVPQ